MIKTRKSNVTVITTNGVPKTGKTIPVCVVVKPVFGEKKIATLK